MGSRAITSKTPPHRRLAKCRYSCAGKPIPQVKRRGGRKRKGSFVFRSVKGREKEKTIKPRVGIPKKYSGCRSRVPTMKFGLGEGKDGPNPAGGKKRESP